MEKRYNKDLIPFAKTLRKNMTKEEKHLWYDYLREHPARFTKQKVLGKYIADFYSAKAKLVIEIDGSQHNTLEAREYDSRRTEYLEQFGIRVIRYTNQEINKKFREVCRSIDRYSGFSYQYEDK